MLTRLTKSVSCLLSMLILLLVVGFEVLVCYVKVMLYLYALRKCNVLVCSRCDLKYLYALDKY